MGMQKQLRIDVGTSEELWPFRVVNEIQKVMEEGQAEYPDNNWHKAPAEMHIDRAIEHLLAYTPEKSDEDHLAHAFTRIMMAVAIERGYVNA